MLTVEDIKKILNDVQYLNWIFFVAEKKSQPSTPDYLQVQFSAKCTTTGQAQGWSGRKWPLSQWMTRSEIVMTAFKAILTAVEHEARESFLYKGQQIFGPHIDVDVLAQIYLSRGDDALDIRPPIQEQGQQNNDETSFTRRETAGAT
jgi:hypothetical protein